ncbi:MAG TPA: protease [Thermoanaerobaculia bacterium]|nr:protease [Thermoanaerobaculia bacterium]
MKLRARLEAAASYAPDEPVKLRFALENAGSSPVSVLVWNTPLEGLAGDAFHVTRDGAVVPYTGRMVKRGDPSAEAYRRIEPGQAATAEVDLATAYDLSSPGAYRVEWNGRIHDVAGPGDRVPRPRDQHRGLDVSGNAVTFRRAGR